MVSRGGYGCVHYPVDNCGILLFAVRSGSKDAEHLYVRILSERRLFSTWLGGGARRMVWVFSAYDVVAYDEGVAPF